DIVAVVETPKSTVEVECFETGTVTQLLAEEGQTVPVGEALAILGADAEEAAGAPAAPVAQAAARPPLSPVLRHLARELGVDPTTLAGTGLNGALTRHDVERAAAAATATSPPRAGSSTTTTPMPATVSSAATTSSTGSATTAPTTRSPATAPGTRSAASASWATAPSGREPVATSHRARVSPLARRLAAEGGVDLTGVHGSGADGSIRAEDVRRAGRHTASSGRPPAPPAPSSPTAHPAPPRPPSPVEVKAHTTSVASSPPPMSDMRRSIAALMTVSNQQIPHYHLSLTVDLWRSLQWMKERNRELEMSERLVPAALLLVATARAAAAVPELNGHWIDGTFRPAEDIDLGLILSLRSGGLLVPAIAGADRLTIEEMMASIKVLTRRARSGRLRGSDLVPPSITVSNLGDQGVDSVFGVIYPPQVALVGFGAVAERPWAVDGLLGVRPVVTMTLAGDHRATDGATGSRLLKTIDRLLQAPEEL
ncbi:MAG TPA: dihydrolipoamide acetyltransferase family protein, partial [Humibacillus sp.]|nr:dihydrolipoamide acetyltransferase family protein [Humibacillus sp.]